MADEVGMHASPVATLKSILVDYPGGQLLAEALQNAEDVGATSFCMVLDLRKHDAIDPKLAGPAFVLIDNGAGFKEAEWNSLKRMHASGKQNSPEDIGQFGMGSRSYFHYTDIIQVVSNGIYKGFDPVERIKSAGRSGIGWSCRLLAELDENKQEQQSEARQLFFTDPGSAPPQLQPGRGASFRLPLRREEDVIVNNSDSDSDSDENNDTGLEQPPITADHAEELLSKWAASLDRLLLFLARVEHVSLWHWAEDEATPTLVAETRKVYEKGTPCRRLPDQLPPLARKRYKTLAKHLGKQSPAELQTLSEMSTAVVRIDTTLSIQTAAESTQTSRTWLIAQRFDVRNEKLRQAMKDGCPSIPRVGVALPLDAKPRVGIPFCFLPIGTVETALPVHLNASFFVHKNRRNLWLDDSEKATFAGEMDQHTRWSSWNKVLLNSALPELWKDALMVVREMNGIDRAQVILASLPDLQKLHSPWQECAVALYNVSSGTAILPHHSFEGEPRWIPPDQAAIVSFPTAALKHQASTLSDLYKKCQEFGSMIVHLLPYHIEAACVEHAGLKRMGISEFLARLVECIASANQEKEEKEMKQEEEEVELGAKVSSLALSLIALAEYLDKKKEEQAAWAERLANYEWVPLLGGGHTKTSLAFAPRQRHLEDAKLGVVSRGSADLQYDKIIDGDAVLRVGRVWGLKVDLSWDDVLQEALDIAERGDRANSERLFDYLEQRAESLKAGPGAALRQQIQKVAFVPGIHPALGPLKSIDPVDGEIGLFKPSELLPQRVHNVVWAVRPTARVSSKALLDIGTLVLGDIEKQIIALTRRTGSPVHMASHLLVCCKCLSNNFEVAEINIPALREVAWIPSTFNGSLRLVQPSHVALKNVDLNPSFGSLHTDWRKLERPLLNAIGVEDQLAFAVLIDELNNLAHPPLDIGVPELAARLVTELASRCKDEDNQALKDKVMKTCHLPTRSGKFFIAGSVFINDAEAERLGEPVEVLHDAISHETGRLLGCTSVRAELSRRCESTDFDEVHVHDEVFGQSEALSDRIEGLLRDYNGPIDVFVEHWQNSDDAGAEKVLFCFDESTYNTSNMVDERACALQGPALLLASSRPLSGDGIANMQKLGVSGKRSGFGSVGRFGVGLNCMYHISDAFTLLGNDALHIFDPMQKVVTRGEATGKKFQCHKLEQSFPNMLQPFERLKKDGWPTIFRLPLRQKASTFGKVESPEDIRDMMKQFASSMNESLVFCQQVRSAEVMNITLNGDKQKIAKVKMLPTPDELHQLMQALPESIKQVQQLCHAPLRAVSEVEILETSAASSEPIVSRWIISHVVECSQVLLDLIQSRYDAKATTALLPHGAAALRIDDACGKFRGGICCYFPLPGFECGLPLLLHGAWDLHSSRKAIPLSSGSCANDSTKWNCALLNGPVAASLVALVGHCQKHVSSVAVAEKASDAVATSDAAGDAASNATADAAEHTDASVDAKRPLALSTYLNLLTLDSEADSKTAELRGMLRQATLRLVLEKQLAVFPVATGGGSKSPIVQRWVSSNEIVLRIGDSKKLCATIQDHLVMSGMPLVRLPRTLGDTLKTLLKSESSPSSSVLSPVLLCKHLRSNGVCGPLADSDNVDKMLQFVVTRPDSRKGDASHLICWPASHF
jgi:hypothetical protein